MECRETYTLLQIKYNYLEEHLVVSLNKKQLIKNINSGNNLKENLPIFLEKMADNYYQQAVIHVTMQYYTLYEQVLEQTVTCKEIEETRKVIHDCMGSIYSQTESADFCELSKKLDQERNKVIRKMEVLTGYTDRLLVYEYILNRIEYQFKDEQIEFDETVFAQELMSYIFGVQENYVINERVKEVIGQLPIRMARTKYFELLKNSMSLYKGSDKSSLDTYLYMIKTSAMLYQPEGIDTYFTELKEVMGQFDDADYENLSESDYTALYGLLQEKAQFIKEISDCFVSMQEIINNLYVISLLNEKMQELNNVSLTTCTSVISSIYKLFSEEELQEIPGETMEKLFELEGFQEELGMDAQVLESALFMVGETYRDELKKFSMEEKYNSLLMVNKLLSTSIFMELKEETVETVSDACVEFESKELLRELSELFSEKSIRIVRAIIASTIDKMPVFFQTQKEISDYVEQSLYACKDKAEKQASYEILKSILEDGK